MDELATSPCITQASENVHEITAINLYRSCLLLQTPANVHSGNRFCSFNCRRLCSAANSPTIRRAFIGTYYSTFTGFITRMRGYYNYPDEFSWYYWDFATDTAQPRSLAQVPWSMVSMMALSRSCSFAASVV